MYVYMYACTVYVRGGLMILSRRPFFVVRLREYWICFYLASRGPPSKFLGFLLMLSRCGKTHLFIEMLFQNCNMCFCVVSQSTPSKRFCYLSMLSRCGETHFLFMLLQICGWRTNCRMYVKIATTKKTSVAD